MNLTALRAETQRLLGETSTHFFGTTDLDAELNLAQRVMAEWLPGYLIANSLYTDKTTAIVNGQSTYDIHADIKRLLYVKTFGYYAHEVDFSQDTELKTNNFRIPNKTHPLFSKHHGSKVEIYPTPETSDPDIIMTGIEEPDDMTTGTDIPPFAANVHYLLTLYAAGRLEQMDKEPGFASAYLQEFWQTIMRHATEATEYYPGLERAVRPQRGAPQPRVD